MSAPISNPDMLRFIQLRGSVTVMRVIQKIGFQYMDEHPDIRLPLIGGGSAIGYKSVLDGSSAIGMASGEMPANIKLWADKNKLALESHSIAKDGIAAIVNTANPINDLSLDQLHDIFTGKITNWSAVGKYSGPINVVSHDPQLGTYEHWRRQVAGKDYITLKAKVITNLDELLQAITTDPFSIGYLGNTFLSKAKVKPIAINGFMPNYQNILSEKYPIRNELYLLTRPSPNKEIKEFIAYCLNDQKGQTILQGMGLVPMGAKS
jgi:phosphate transport system substrate-binding protein